MSAGPLPPEPPVSRATRELRLLRLAARGLIGDWLRGPLRVLGLALTIAVAATSAVGLFTDRVDSAMRVQGAELLAADLVIDAPDPIEPGRAREAKARGLRVARALSFRSMVMAGQRLRLAEVKAVGPAYPLRGRLEVADRAFDRSRPVDRGPEHGTCWLDARLARALGLEVGSRVAVGRTELRFSAVLSYEPDRGGDLFSIAPRLLMHIDDVAATGLIQPGSRVRHRLLLAGEERGVAGYRDWLRAHPAPGERLRGLTDARPELRMALERARSFLGLAALIGVVLAGVAVALSAAYYARGQMDAVAVMRTLGATRGQVMRLYLARLTLLGSLAGGLGLVIGFLAQAGLSRFLAGLYGAALPAPTWPPAAEGLLVGLLTLLGFATPSLMRLSRVSPGRILRRELTPLPSRAWVVLGLAGASLSLLAWLQVGHADLALYTLSGLGLGLGVFYVAARALVAATALLPARPGLRWRFGLASIPRRRETSVLSIMAFALGGSVLLLLSVVRYDLLETWRRGLPEDAPNYFLINVQAGDVTGIQTLLGANRIRVPGIYPMVRGRLVAINDRPVRAADYPSARAQRLVEREFNLSWSARLPPANRVIAGRWWGARGEGHAWLSVEQGLAETLGIHLEDRLTFRVQGQPVQARVTSLRSVEWDSFQVNFFVLAPPALLDGLPATYITSFHLPPGTGEVLAELVAAYPSVTVLDVEALIGKVRALMDRAVLAVEAVFAFSLLAGLAVLAAAIQSTLPERRREGAVLRTLGASRRQVRSGLLAEFATLGAIAGLLAALASTLIALVLGRWVLELPYVPGLTVWILGPLGGAFGVGLAGLAGTRGVLAAPPWASLRQG